MEGPGLWGLRRDGELLFNGRNYVEDAEKPWGIDSGDGYTAL